MGTIAITNRLLVLEIFGYARTVLKAYYWWQLHSLPIWNFLTTLAFLECFYTVLINKKQILKESEDFSFHPYYVGRKTRYKIGPLIVCFWFLQNHVEFVEKRSRKPHQWRKKEILLVFVRGIQWMCGIYPKTPNKEVEK